MSKTRDSDVCADARNILSAYGLLCRQDEGDLQTPDKILTIARTLADRGHWRRSIAFVVFAYKSLGAFPNFEDIPTWCRWILNIVPQSERARYKRVAFLLMVLFKTSIMDRDAAAFYVIRSAGDIPDEYKSMRLLFQIALLGDLCSYGGPASVDFFADGIVRAARYLEGEDRLTELITSITSNNLHGSMEYVCKQLAALELYCGDLGFHSIVVEAISQQVSVSMVQGNRKQALLEAMRALSYGPVSRATFRKVALASNIVPLVHQYGDEVMVRQFRQILDGLLQLPNLYPLLRRTLLASMLSCLPEDASTIMDALKADIDITREVYSVGGASFVGSELAKAGYCPVVNGRTPWIMEGTIQYARRFVESRSTDRIRLSLLSDSVFEHSSVKRDIPHRSLSVGNRLSMAKVRHDLKYGIAFLRRTLDQFETMGSSSNGELNKAIAAVLNVFSTSSISLTAADVDTFLTTHAIIAEALEGKRTLLMESGWHIPFTLSDDLHYETLNSILFNIVFNAYRHSPPSSQIRVHRAVLESNAILTVTNSCRTTFADEANRGSQPNSAFPPHYHPHGIGLELIKKLATEAGLDLSTHQNGTTFTAKLVLPL
jgi:hypothetical protein